MAFGDEFFFYAEDRSASGRAALNPLRKPRVEVA